MSDKHKDAPSAESDEQACIEWAERHYRNEEWFNSTELSVALNAWHYACAYTRAALAGRASQVSAAALTDERAKFEAWHRSKFATKHSTGQPTRDMHNGVYADKYGPENQQHMWNAWQARASEGQAQTSAAAGNYRTCCSHPDCIMCGGRGGYYRAAQLADKTYPGATVTDDIPITRSTYGSKEACEAEHARRLAAPTAQQSTAGGAKAEFNKGYLVGWNACRAAVPLMQVQPSEALEAARYALRHAGSLYSCGFNVAHARSRTNGVDETGVSAEEYETAADDIRLAISKALDLVRDALKPSVAQTVADTTVEVKS